MTTPDSAPAASRGFPFGKLVVGVLAGFVLALGFGAGALLAYQGQYEDRIYPGVTVDGVSVAGLSRDAATATLERALAGYGRGEAVLVFEDGDVRIPYAALGRRADVDTLVELAWSVGRGRPGPLEQGRAGRPEPPRRHPDRAARGRRPRGGRARGRSRRRGGGTASRSTRRRK